MTAHRPATIDELRRDVAALLDDEGVLGAADGDDLLELGIDSIRMMTLVTRWNERGIEIGFVELIEDPTLDAWLRLVREAPQAPAPQVPAPQNPAPTGFREDA